MHRIRSFLVFWLGLGIRAKLFLYLVQRNDC